MGRNLHAFTLIELMVVIVLIGILTAVILPEMKGTYEGTLLRSTSRELVGVCDLASSQAISRNQQLVLQFDSGAGRYSIEPGPTGRALQAGASSREVPGGQGQWDTRISIAIRQFADNATEMPSGGTTPVPVNPIQSVGREKGITFYPDGTADPTEIVLRDRDGFGLALRINPVTARVRIMEIARP